MVGNAPVEVDAPVEVGWEIVAAGPTSTGASQSNESWEGEAFRERGDGGEELGGPADPSGAGEEPPSG